MTKQTFFEMDVFKQMHKKLEKKLNIVLKRISIKIVTLIKFYRLVSK